MGFKITVAAAAHPAVIAEERLWLTADRDRVVKEGDDEAAFLLVGVGQRIPWADAVRYGLVEDTPDPSAEVAPPARSRGRRGAAPSAATAVEPSVEPELPVGGLTIVSPDTEEAG